MSGAHIPTRPTFWGILLRLIRLSVSAETENMFLKFSRYKCAIKRSCFGGTALMATKQVTDTIYTWTRLPSRWTESAKCVSYTFLCAVGSVIVCLHKVVCDWSLFSATFQAFVLPMPLCGVSPKLPYCVVITSIFLKIWNVRECLTGHQGLLKTTDC